MASSSIACRLRRPANAAANSHKQPPKKMCRKNPKLRAGVASFKVGEVAIGQVEGRDRHHHHIRQDRGRHEQDQRPPPKYQQHQRTRHKHDGVPADIHRFATQSRPVDQIRERRLGQQIAELLLVFLNSVADVLHELALKPDITKSDQDRDAGDQPQRRSNRQSRCTASNARNRQRLQKKKRSKSGMWLKARTMMRLTVAAK